MGTAATFSTAPIASLANVGEAARVPLRIEPSGPIVAPSLSTRAADPTIVRVSKRRVGVVGRTRPRPPSAEIVGRGALAFIDAVAGSGGAPGPQRTGSGRHTSPVAAQSTYEQSARTAAVP